MKPSYFCRKCLVKTMCNEKCDHIRSILSIINVLSISFMVSLPITWATGFGLALTIQKPSENVVLAIFSCLLALSTVCVFALQFLADSINKHFK